MSNLDMRERALLSTIADLRKRIERLEARELIGNSAVTFAITDGVTAPDAVSGQAILYVDSADGDLKVRFGDGTIKTITIDT